MKVSADEQLELVRLAQAGDRDAVDKLVRCTMGMVIKMATRYSYGDENRRDDLVQIGSMAVLRAIEAFDHSRGCRFITYATTAIIRGIQRTFKKQSEYEMGVDDEGRSHSQMVEAPRDDALSGMVKADDRARVAAIARFAKQQIAKLPDRDQMIVTMRLEGEKLHEIGELVGISKERVRQITDKAIIAIAAKIRKRFDVSRDWFAKDDE